MKTYDTLSQAIQQLTCRGYTIDLNIRSDDLHSTESDILLHPEEFKIDEWHRFQEMSDMDNETILFAISSETYNLKGLLVNAFGTYADPALGQLVAKLSFDPATKRGQ